MKLSVKPVQWLSITVLTAVAAFAAGQNPALPAGEGKVILDTSCAGCHGMEVLEGKQLSKDDWMPIVARMQTYGAIIDEKQVTTLVDYLVANLGPKADPSKAATPAPAAPETTPAEAPKDPAEVAKNDEAAKKSLDTACAGCHGLDLVSGRMGTAAEWQDIVDRMIGRGAPLTEKDVAPLVDYLARTYAYPAK